MLTPELDFTELAFVLLVLRTKTKMTDVPTTTTFLDHGSLPVRRVECSNQVPRSAAMSSTRQRISNVIFTNVKTGGAEAHRRHRLPFLHVAPMAGML